MTIARVSERLVAILDLPRAEQVDAARALIASLPLETPPESWNSRFGADSLFDAWTRTSIARSVHRHLADEVRPFVQREGFRIVEVGGGNGQLWRALLTGAERGEIVVVDLLEAAVDAVRDAVPPGVTVTGHVGSVQDIALPPCDALVCSMTLHHVAGRDAEERARHGLTGPGKREVLAAFGAALGPRDGTGFLVEADVDCEVDLAPGDPVLADHIFDSYVRRCGRAILGDLRDPGTPEALKDRFEGLLRFWFLEQLAVADVPVPERDVYELTIPRWKALIEAAGLKLEAHRCLDDHALFQLYTFRSRHRPS